MGRGILRLASLGLVLAVGCSDEDGDNTPVDVGGDASPGDTGDAGGGLTDTPADVRDADSGTGDGGADQPADLPDSADTPADAAEDGLEDTGDGVGEEVGDAPDDTTADAGDVVEVDMDPCPGPDGDDLTYVTREDTALDLELTSAEGGAGSTFALVADSGPSHGTLSGEAPHLTYTPDADFAGVDGFSFTATADGLEGACPGTVALEVLEGRLIFVDPILGDNGNDGTHAEAPVADLATALGLRDADYNDVVALLPGTYVDTTLSISGDDKLFMQGMGASPGEVILQGDGAFPVVFIWPSRPARLENLTIEEGVPGIRVDAGASVELRQVVLQDNDEGAILAGDITFEALTATGNANSGIRMGELGTLTGSDLTLTANGALDGPDASFGGGLNMGPDSVVVVDGCLIAENEAESGGGIYTAGDHFELTRCVLRDNEAADYGGALRGAACDAASMLRSSAVIGNQAGLAGSAAFLVGCGLESENVTYSGNLGDAGDSGVVVADASAVRFYNVTFADNVRGAGTGDIVLEIDGPPGAGFIEHSVFRWPAGGLACDGTTLNSEGFNAIPHDGESCVVELGSDLLGTVGSPLDVMLGPLADNGGPTPFTHLPQTGSPLIDGGDTTCLDDDQRGLPRPADGDDVAGARCDIGAVEVQP